MTEVLEGVVQKEIMEYLKNEKIFHLRINAGIANGLPDVVAIYKGYFVGIEVKRPSKNAEDLQRKMAAAIIKAGAYSIVAKSVEDVKTILRQIDHDCVWRQ